MNIRLTSGFVCLLWAGLLPATVNAQFTYTTNNGALTITGYTGSGDKVMIPGQINGRRVVSIGAAGFAGSSVTNVTIPASIASIGDGAFGNCYGLTAVYFQGNAPILGSMVFGSLNFPPPATPGWIFPNVYYQPNAKGWSSSFGGCPAYLLLPPYFCTVGNRTLTIAGYLGSNTKLVIPNGLYGLTVAGIGDQAFANSTVKEVFIPSSVTSIGKGAFAGSPLTSLAFLPGSTATIGDNAFSACGHLTTVIFPSQGHIAIGNWSFADCNRLTSLTLSDSVTSIGYMAFGRCTVLTQATIARTVTSLGEFAFYNCSNLKIIMFQGNAPAADNTVFTGDSLATVYYRAGTQGWGSTFGGAPAVAQ